MEQKIDWKAALDGSRPVTTRDGRKVVLYCVDAPGDLPVHGRVGSGLPRAWRINGRYRWHIDSSGEDLIQPPRRFKYEGWVNVYPDGVGGHNYNTREDAGRGCVKRSRIACIKIIIEGEEGEGLE